MKHRVLIAGIALVLVAAIASGAYAIPRMWELEVRCAHPQAVTIKGAKGDRAYWYVVYTVKNQHDEEKPIRPAVTITDNLGGVRRDIYEPAVLEVVKKRTGYDPANVTNAAATLKPGETRDCVAVFEMPSREANRLTLAIYGTAGKRVEKRDGVTGIASRVYNVVYSAPGDRYNFTPDGLKVVSKGYVNSFRVFGDEGKVLGKAPDARAVKLPESAGETVDVPLVGAVTRTAKAVSDPLDLLPGGLQGLGWVNLREVADTGVIDKIIEMGAEQGKDADEMLKMLKLDPNKDLTALAVGIGDFTADEPDGAIVITGRFDAEAIYTAARDNADAPVESVTYKGYDMLHREEGGLMAVLDGKVLLIGSEEVAKKVVDIHKGDAKPGAKSSPMMARVKDLGNETFWFTADVNIPAQPGGPDPGMAMMMPGLDPSKIKAVTVSGKVTKEAFRLKAVLGCADADSAAAMMGGLKQGVNMLAGMSAMFTGGDPEATKAVGELIQTIKISSEGASAGVELKITAELAEKLKALGAKMGGAMIGRPGGATGPGVETK